jgi:hypothetical protein
MQFLCVKIEVFELVDFFFLFCPGFGEKLKLEILMNVLYQYAYMLCLSGIV